MVPDSATIVCDTPKAHLLPRWCVTWCKATYGKEVAADAASLLVELIGPEMGLLDQIERDGTVRFGVATEPA